MNIKKPLPKWVIYTFFIIGLIAAACFRLLIVFKYLSPELFRPIWYIAVIGYLVFFLYRYYIAEKRRHAIRESGLIKKLSSDQALDDHDRQGLLYVLNSVMISRENWNYLAIFILSIAAIVLDLFLARV